MEMFSEQAEDLKRSTPFMVVMSSNFTNNTARTTGDTLFTSAPNALDLCCGCDFDTEEKLGSLWVPETNPATGVVKVNRARQQGILGRSHTCIDPISGMMLSKQEHLMMATTAWSVTVCRKGTFNCTDGRFPLVIKNHTSGGDLEPIEVELLDAFGNTAVGQQGMQIRVGPKSSSSLNDVLPIVLSGQLFTEASAKTTFSNIRMESSIGQTQELLLSFVPSTLPSVPIRVEVRPCLPGEIEEGGIVGGAHVQRCTPCAEGLYTFNPVQGKCTPCPSDAICSPSTITPRDEYWHSTSKSVQVHGCIFRGACNSNNRTRTLADEAREAHMMNITLGYGDNLAYTQCAPVSFPWPWCMSVVFVEPGHRF